MQKNIKFGLAYVFSIVGGLILVLGFGEDKEHKYVGMQAIAMWALSMCINILPFICGFLPVIKSVIWVVSPILNIAWFVIWLILCISAFQGKHKKIPYLSDLVAQQAGFTVTDKQVF